MNLPKCIYPDWEGGYTEGEHMFAHDGTCVVCGEPKTNDLVPAELQGETEKAEYQVGMGRRLQVPGRNHRRRTMSDTTESLRANHKKWGESLTLGSSSNAEWELWNDLGSALERLEAAETERRTDDALLKERNRVLDAIPECSKHGRQCVPHALEWIADTLARSAPNDLK